MKNQIENLVKKFALPFLILVATLAFEFGCGTTKPAPDPLAGWQMALKNPNQVITSDYQNYIRTLSPDEQKFVAYVECFEDGTGQYAVKITIGLNHTNWEHVLVYDKDNKRIKVIKYVSGHSAS